MPILSQVEVNLQTNIHEKNVHQVKYAKLIPTNEKVYEFLKIFNYIMYPLD